MKKIILILFVLLSVKGYCQTSESFYKNAQELEQKEDYKGALIQIDNALKTDSLNVHYLGQKAGILSDLKEYQKSYDLFSKVISIDDENIGAYNDRGLLLYSIQQFDESIRDFSRGLDFAKSDSDRNLLLINRAASEMLKRDFTEAYDDLIKVYKRDSSNIGMLVNLAGATLELGRSNESLIYLKRVLVIDPKSFYAYGNIGYTYQQMGDYKKAVAYYDTTISLKPDDPLGYSNRSYNRIKSGDIKGAYSDIEKSLKMYPENAYAYKVRALIYIQDKKTGLACKDLNKAVELGYTKMYGDEVNDLIVKYCK